MFKVCSVVDKTDTAIDRLAKGMSPFMTNIDYNVVDVHPKRPDLEQLHRFEKAARDADLIDFQYFRTAKKLDEIYPWVKEKKRLLTHHNPYSIEEDDWNEFDVVVANNKTIFANLKNITTSRLELIGNTIDTDFWKYNPDWKPEKSVIMVANRIESKKGILEVAIACADLGIKFRLIGSISDANYFHSIMQTGNVEFHEQITDELLRDLYYKSMIHVCNSKDNFESGTLPILEAMLCGVPVLTREIGHVPDIYNDDNLVLHKGSHEDVQAITELLHNMVTDKKKLEELRQAGWNSAKVRSNERRAYKYQKLYRDVVYPQESPVSVVVPIHDRPEVIRESLNAIEAQTYKNIEIIVVDDSEGVHVDLIKEFSRYTSKPVRYMNSGQGDYGLARARNLGTIEATGEIMVYCDQRIIMEPDCIEQFVLRLQPKKWLYGNKGAKKDFVENLSCVYREDLINFGMFNERINEYGGQSQELRTRFRNQGGETIFIEHAKGVQRGKSSNRNRKREEIIRMKNRLWKMGLE